MHRSGAPYRYAYSKENDYRVDPVKRGHNTMEGLARSILRQISHHALRWDGCLLESQEGLEIKVGLRTNLNRALVRCLAGTDYRIPELVSDDLVMGSRLCMWSLTFAWQDFEFDYRCCTDVF
ncbi:hypothetical protein M9H77_03052 [Catharanthus roseus]|uniref:Uncharacterized protein n=1 Tax=Catharanthus roseus TaxID=4058 RepID=A0ACC0CAL1_CATRO|nr:hypothetical protein M9H77_03052 [Catharanthus roseus]